MDIKKALVGTSLFLVIVLFFVFASIFLKNFDFKKATGSVLDSQITPSSVPLKKGDAISLEINAKSAISVFVGKNGQQEILFAKNETDNLPIASITKLVTALVVLDNYDLSQKVLIDADSSSLEKGRPASVLAVGQSFFVKSLLNLMLVDSNSTAADSLAKVAGYDRFLQLMNEKAKAIGLSDVIFSTPVGRGNTNLMSVQDVVKILNYINLNKPEIFDISSQKSYILFDSNFQFVRNVQNINSLLDDPTLSERIIGGKTGETVDAGQCLALIVKAKDRQNYIINVVLNSDDRFSEMKKIINWDDASYDWQIDNSVNLVPDGQQFDPANLDWKQATASAAWPARDSHAVVVFKDKIWLMGGLNANGRMTEPGFVDYILAPHFSDVWSSEDGVNWQLVNDKAPWGPRRSIELVAFNNKMWLMGGYSPESGYKNDVWSTEDGVNWKQEVASAAWPAREGHQLVVFQNKIWLLGGVKYDKEIAEQTDEKKIFNDVWYSSDGVNWIEATEHAQWPARWDHAATVFQDKIWIADGMIFGSTMFKDVWSSEDGVNWTQTTENAPFSVRQGNFLTEYHGKLFLIGRLDGVNNGGVNDVWYSDDGSNWQKTKKDPLWLGREDLGAEVFKDKIWIFGGMDSNWTWTNNIWYSTF